MREAPGNPLPPPVLKDAWQAAAPGAEPYREIVAHRTDAASPTMSPRWNTSPTSP
jgi:hypothetical protein